MDFFKYLKTVSVDDNDRSDIKFFHEYLSGKHSTRLSSKIVALVGEAGVGKTHLARRFVKSLEIPILYVGQEDISGRNIKTYSSVRNLSRAKMPDNCLVYLDDLNYQSEENEYGEMSIDYKRVLLKILAKIKSLPRAGLLITTNFLDFDTQFVDRVNIIIEVESPNKNSKKKFLKSEYSEFLDNKKINQIAKNSIGFNFRDIDEVIRMSYRYGRGNFTKDSIKTALTLHEPTNFRNYEVHKDIELKFKDVIGRDEIKNKLKEVILVYNNKKYIDKFGLKRTNLLIFYGEPGLGKTYMAKAFAGELGFPLVNMNSFSIYGRMGPIGAFNGISHFAKRFKDSIIFIDEADKLIGRGLYDTDGPMQGMLNEVFDGVKGIKDSLVILAMNNINNFGSALHDRFALIEFGYPSSGERKQFFLTKINEHKDVFDEVDADELARRTEKMSFRDIEKIWNVVIYTHISSKHKVGMKEFQNAINPFKKEENMVFG